MEAEIGGEDEEYVKIYLTDNTGAEHNLTVEKEGGEIAYHEGGDYPDDPDKRTHAEDERNSQVRKYSKYYVYRNTEFDTLPAHQNPDRVAATAMTLWQTPEDKIDEIFGTFQQQSRSHFEDTTRPVELPSAVGTDDSVSYRQNIYIDADSDELRGAVDTFVEHMADNTADVLGSISGGSVFEQTVDSVLSTVNEHAEDHDFDFPAHEIDSTSELYFLYYVARGDHETVKRGDPYNFERGPDARMELPQLPPETLEEFKALLVRHLICQVRDLYIVMGEDPPAPFRVLGPGKHFPTQRYRHNDFYPDYFDFDADIPGYTS